MTLISKNLLQKLLPIISKHTPNRFKFQIKNYSSYPDATILSSPFVETKPEEITSDDSFLTPKKRSPLYFNPKNKIRKLKDDEKNNSINFKSNRIKKGSYVRETVLTNELLDGITEHLFKPYELEYDDFSIEFFHKISPMDLFQYLSTINETENLKYSEILPRIYTIENFRIILNKLIGYHISIKKSSRLNFKIEKQFGLAYTKLATEIFKTLEISINSYLYLNRNLNKLNIDINTDIDNTHIVEKTSPLTFNQYKQLIKFFGENYKVDTVNYYFKTIPYELDIELWNYKFKYLSDGQPELWSFERTKEIGFNSMVNPIWFEKKRSHGYKAFTQLFYSFEAQNVPANEDTVALIILCLAKNTTLNVLQGYIYKHWGVKVEENEEDGELVQRDDKVLFSNPIKPNYNILRSIITSFGYHKEFLKGLMTVMMIEKKFSDSISLSDPRALPFWKSLYQWADLTTSNRVLKKKDVNAFTDIEKLEKKVQRKELLSNLWLYYLRTHSNKIDLDMINLRFNILRRSNDIRNIISDLPILHMNYINNKDIYNGIFARYLTYTVKMSSKTNHELVLMGVLNRFSDKNDQLILLFIEKLQQSIDEKLASNVTLKGMSDEGLVDKQIRLEDEDDSEFDSW